MEIHENLIQEFVFTYDEFLTRRYRMLCFSLEKGCSIGFEFVRTDVVENTQLNYNKIDVLVGRQRNISMRIEECCVGEIWDDGCGRGGCCWVGGSLF